MPCEINGRHVEKVALLAEGVDRNPSNPEAGYTEEYVALLAEGVDRNTCPLWKYTDKPRSPSSRRAWIEITQHTAAVACGVVALLAEGVDRNWSYLEYCDEAELSPSSRRAWIEMPMYLFNENTLYESPSSRRAWIEIS